MAYDRSGLDQVAYGDSLGEFAFTAGATMTIKGPRGKVGIVRDFEADVTTSIVGTTSVPEIQVGISSGDSTYGRFRMGTTASLGYGTGAFRASQLAVTGNPPRVLSDFSGHIVLDGGTAPNLGGRIPADTAFTIAVVAAVGSAAGKARLRVYIEWIGSNMGG